MNRPVFALQHDPSTTRAKKDNLSLAWSIMAGSSRKV